MVNGRAARVVFVDDEPRVCAVVRKTLHRAGVNVECFHCANDCLAHLAGQPCDLLITDVKMPGKDGIELLREVKERLPWLPVLLVTGYGEVPLAVRALHAGAADLVEKPLDRAAFLQTVEQLIEQTAGPISFLEGCLTRAETRVLYLILNGKNNREIAERLHRSLRTVEVHRRHVMQKLGATNLVELSQRAAEIGLFQPGFGHRPDVPSDPQ
jgi:FixJ family two-component response regulator